MRRMIAVVVLAVAGLVVGRHLLVGGSRPSPAAMRRKMMDRMMRAMPEGSPPKVITSVLPRLHEQNEEIIALLKEQNALLRAADRSAGARERLR